MWTANTVKRPPQQPAQPQHANCLAPLTHKRHTPPHPAQPRHTNYWALRTRKRHQQEHRPQRPTERSDPKQHAKGRPGDCPGPRKETRTRRNVTQGRCISLHVASSPSEGRPVGPVFCRHPFCRHHQSRALLWWVRYRPLLRGKKNPPLRGGEGPSPFPIL